MEKHGSKEIEARVSASNEKKNYCAPVLKVHGTVEELTLMAKRPNPGDGSGQSTF